MSTRRKTNGKFIADVYDEFGERHPKTFNTKAEAKAFEASLTKEKYENRLIKTKLKKKRYLFEEQLKHFELSKQELRPGSIKRYKFIINQIRVFGETMGVIYVDQFTPDHATRFKEELTRERKDPTHNTNRMVTAKPKTINFYLATIKAFFQHEYIQGHIATNPLLHIKNMRIEKKKADYYSINELKAFFAQEMCIEYRQIFMGFLLTGLRFAELANLQWNDIDLVNLTIYVHSKEGFVTKTHNGERLIPIGTDLYKLLKFMRNKQNGDDIVFLTPKGCKIRERSLLHACKAIAKSASISSKANIHKFRHTYATMLIHRGVSIQNIKELLGHHSVVQTEIYAHNKADHLHNDVSKLDHLLSQ